ncbi:helix-turn-helix domain-containing protein [Rhizobium ruizarguesonis]|uniref:helix-turn-helix domain-containing protein n=1 Tax=Rhizobium ruizarguesonis TaxID=2081791 RepID=UPI0013B8E51C|nr:helix-turn-helix transcriptional regulator [Rhizobium ruizarguesonis]NEH64594.1 helix-turn-helix domain-containing protein [Rhizobium ruizarguesonis]NEH78086.1 helix-turn-helix domain-containing protein [Rhizobium ruizarguesonis]NEI78517.1 helix-turn-helix domain-containing protein [Rhizobium ruizarguesonis]
MSEVLGQGAAIPLDLVMLVDGIRKRVAAAASVYEVAEAANVTAPTLYAFIKKERVPTIDTLQKLCNHFAITVDVATHKQVMPPVVRPIS